MLSPGTVWGIGAEDCLGPNDYKILPPAKGEEQHGEEGNRAVTPVVFISSALTFTFMQLNLRTARQKLWEERCL